MITRRTTGFQDLCSSVAAKAITTTVSAEIAVKSV